ncbi:MAG: sel1 repeat family protein [Betaproteobacteria bacterium]|nr:sel1 repeat family protein [Betaproteobacteria bacterium]
MKWYRLSAVQGNDAAEHNLGVIYESGQGVPKDYVRARMWFSLAALDGNADAVTSGELIGKLMTPQQMAEARKMAEDCRRQDHKCCD